KARHLVSRSNFDFLLAKRPRLAGLAAQAETYCHEDPQSAAIKLRCFAELFVGYIYKRHQLPEEKGWGFFERLENPMFQEAVEGCVVEKLHAIRLKGNKAAHGEGVSPDDAL